MIVKEKNWEKGNRAELKKVLVADLFNKIGVMLATKRKETGDVTEEYADKINEIVDHYFYTLVGSTTPFSMMIPDKLKDANKFYIFTIVVLPTGGVLLNFIARLQGDLEPVVLDMIY